MRRNFFYASKRPVAVQRSGRSPSRQRFTFRATRCTVDKHDSIGLVVISFPRNTAPTPKRCTVSVSSGPSSRLRAALGFDPFQLSEDFLQRLFGLRVVIHRASIAHPPIVVFLAMLGQVLLHIPPVVTTAVFSVTPCHTPKTRFSPPSANPRATTSTWPPKGMPSVRHRRTGKQSANTQFHCQGQRSKLL